MSDVIPRDEIVPLRLAVRVQPGTERFLQVFIEQREPKPVSNGSGIMKLPENEGDSDVEVDLVGRDAGVELPLHSL